jgi:hypothetical protein
MEGYMCVIEMTAVMLNSSCVSVRPILAHGGTTLNIEPDNLNKLVKEYLMTRNCPEPEFATSFVDCDDMFWWYI